MAYRNELRSFYQAEMKKTNVDYLHSIGAKYDFKNDLVLEAWRLVSPKAMSINISQRPAINLVRRQSVHHQLPVYTARATSRRRSVNDIYDGTALRLQALTFGYKEIKWCLRLEGTG